ncbi:hypothetical protein DAY19_08675 [Halobacteriovorax vibrionivorans]|uniref:GHMP kinase N-terminal domain-containing protein n=1 Tax=Halobacteriovorax vibrionivorans TaxID=2152716 RepID=A0ABY0IHZ3_9BACT|nr:MULTISPECIES: hypothetical protein [Halobacteriovorax]RZF21753.1 hypothetical protein DAY19_08675 [Halobacteriovorax vibrionivorans]TGD45868.1 hypothetical protein EP118_14335 [Halobacteriovorax sp. Y22]
MVKSASNEGSVRVDLLGGTLDIVPINQVLRNTITLNLATSLKAKVIVEEIDYEGVEFVSIDYESTTRHSSVDFTNEDFEGETFGPLSFLAQILHHFQLTSGIRLTTESGSPPGAGLGGSSSMGVTVYKALCDFTDREFDRQTAINTVQNIESKILNKGPCGYQDYYPALYGGVLALKATDSAIAVEQLYSDSFKNFLESHLTLVYSGKLRLSAINNWQVYKDFFDHENGVREGLATIRDLTFSAYRAIKDGQFDDFLGLLCREGAQREKLFSGIVTDDMRSLYSKLRESGHVIGMKVCGAGGGGCFILAHGPQHKEAVLKEITRSKMKVLEFSVEAPL